MPPARAAAPQPTDTAQTDAARPEHAATRQAMDAVVELINGKFGEPE